MHERLCQALEVGRRESFFAGLSLDAYLALSKEEEKVLWDRLAKEACREVQLVEREIPSHFRPAGQERRTGGSPRRLIAAEKMLGVILPEKAPRT